ncbi:MAG TPA: hypothetical protein VMF32_25935 [Xanthobacteraceae bacterium]|nr:hypothetical protein [Xanthobacteraceae bacterium]
MSMASKFFKLIGRIDRRNENVAEGAFGIPVAKFDVSKVTDTVKISVQNDIMQLDDIDGDHFDQVYDAALRSISAGRDLSLLYQALLQMNINGMTKERAAEIARLLNNKATALMQKEQLESLGIRSAVWLYSGAPCVINPKTARDWEKQQDAAHRAANGKQYDVSKGMFLNGKWTWPGIEPGCRCVSKAVVSGFS